ncbi:MAG: hypothetical protein HYV35_00245, partial [Lentisphaerae bacterium]|nr:hypothetical protein [Lentisphaerota bacterium]
MKKRWLCGIVCGWLISGSAWAGYDEDFTSGFGMGMGVVVSAYAADLGFHWARLPLDVSPDHATQSNVIEGLYRITDQVVSNLQAAGVVPYGIVNPRTNVNGQYMSAAQYAGVVSNLVERYDGDGLNDMPGLTYPIRVWELVNEYSSTIPGNPGNSLPRTNFISMVIQGSLAIHSACPQAWFAYDPFDTSDTQALLQQMAYTNIDVISFHTYAPLDK